LYSLSFLSSPPPPTDISPLSLHDALPISFLQALLTQRMLRRVLIADPFPCPSISAAYSRIPAVLLVAAVLFFLVFLTKPSLRQVRASRPGTWPFRFSRQYSHLLRT